MSYQTPSPTPCAVLTTRPTTPFALHILPAALLVLALLLAYRHISTSPSDHSLRARLRSGLHGITEQLDVVDLEIDHQTTLLSSLQNEIRRKDTQLADQASQLASQAHKLALKDMAHKMSYVKLNRRNAMLAAQLKATRKEMNDRSFAVFCERLLLNNKVWKGEKALKASAERIRSLEGSVGTEVVVREVDMDADAKKDALVEELIQEIVDDLEESQKHVSTLLSRRDAEVKAINDGWVRDYGILARGMEHPKVGRRVSMVERGAYENMNEPSSDASDDDMGSPTPTVLDDFESESDPDATLLHINAHLKFKLSSMESEDLDLRSLPPPSLSFDEPLPPLNTFSMSCPTSSPVCFSPTFHFSPLVPAHSLPHPRSRSYSHPHLHSHPHPQNPTPAVTPTPTSSDRPTSRYKRPHRDSYPTRDPSSNAALEALYGKLPMWPAHAAQLRADAGVSKSRSAKRAKVGN